MEKLDVFQLKLQSCQDLKTYPKVRKSKRSSRALG